jgi:adenine-specific DNA-methyltransferase
MWEGRNGTMSRNPKRAGRERPPVRRTSAKQVTRYDYSDMTEPRTPETGHTALLSDEQIVTLDMDGRHWSRGLAVAQTEQAGARRILVDLDPAFDPVLVWSGKRNQRDVPVLPLQRNEVVAESRIASIIERAREAARGGNEGQGSLFADLEKELREADKAKRIEFYTHDEGWKNKLICGDSLTVMESLLEYEGLRGRVQMIYIDPPYGISYNANFQQRIDSAENDQGDQADDVVTIKAFRDTWALGIHSYLSYLEERLYLCRDLLADSGSVFVQMNVENEHLVRALLDETFGASNYYATVAFNKTTGFTSRRLSSVYDVLLWYAKDISQLKYRQLYQRKSIGLEGSGVYSRVQEENGARRRLTREELDNIDDLPSDWRIYAADNLSSQGAASEPQPFEFEGRVFLPSPNSHWKAQYPEGMRRLAEQGRIEVSGNTLRYVRFYDDMRVSPISNIWLDTGTGSFTDPKIYAVQTNVKVLERCIAMTTDPGDLVLDPTCGSGTTALASERLGRRWITCDTSRVAINVARRRLLSTVFDHYRTRNGLVSGGFVNETVDRITLKSLAHDMEPERVELVDRPEVDPDAIRVTGPFEVATLGRYSLDDWKGYLVGEGADAGRLQNYISVICRLYRRDAALAPSGGLIHAVVDEGDRRLGLSIGPISGRVTARQVHEATKEALQAGLDEVHVMGWAFEANAAELTGGADRNDGIVVRLMMIRQDTLVDGLAATQPDQLFSPLAVPDVAISKGDDDRLTVSLRGVAVFDRKRRTTEYKPARSGYIAAWYLDEDYDGDCFVDSQMFFDFKRKPAVERTLQIAVDPEEWTLRENSDPFPPGRYRRIGVRVVDVFGNESTLVRELG